MDKTIRQLAAIMFTDMVGYTALMQIDEHKAKKNRDRHRAVLEQYISEYHGLILQYYGDGTLSVFGSAIEAVECAVKIQNELQSEPVIPLRVGLNVGDIVYDDDGVYGDGVNIASRVESLSIPGAILISEKVYDEIKNHRELPARSMGKFNLKNVARPIEIYALLSKGLKVPATGDLAGKADSVGKSIAVLPFVNMSPDPENEYFSDGISEELINALTKVEGLHVTSRTSSFAFKGTRDDVRQIGKQLNVSAVVEGSVRKSSNQLRITAQLINTADGYHIWSEVYDRKLEDIFAVQDEISRKIANQLREKLGRQASAEKLVTSPTNNIEAYNLYLKGNYYWNLWTADSVKKAEFFYHKSLEKERDFPLPYTGISACYSFFGAIGYLPSKEAYPKAKQYAHKALDLDKNLSESHLALAMVQFFFDWDWSGAENSFKRALDLNPGSANSHHYYSMYLMVMHRYDEALEEIKIAISLDPLALPINAALGDALVYSGNITEGIEQYEKTLELDPKFRTAIYHLGWALWQAGQKEKAIQTFKQAHDLVDHALKGITQLGYVYAQTGRIDKANECLEKLKRRQKVEKDVSLDLDFAVIYTGLEKYDMVFEHLERAFEERVGGLVFITNPHWKHLEKDQRFQKFLSKMGLKY
jgi:TolB-like protein/Tfp pilus assembly protein PilF